MTYSSKNPVVPNTVEPRMSEYLHGKGTRLGLPISGTFELTARCNFDCKMCYVHLQNAAELIPKELTADQWLSLAREARDTGMMFLLLTGGEPLIRKDFPYLYTELTKMGLILSVNTNASLYTDEIRALFNQYPPSRINVTLYGGSEETYKSLCGNPSYERVVNNLKKMKEDGQQVRLNVSLTPYNVGDMEAIDAISREIGLQAKAASYMYPPVRVEGKPGENAARFAPEEAGRVMAEWNARRDPPAASIRRGELLRERESAGLTDTCADTEQEGVACRAGRCSFWMTWDGRMLPCGTMDVEASYPLKTGFKAAWDEVRARTAAIRLPAACAACPSRPNCGVCASICKCETGHFDVRPDYFCRMTQSLCQHTIRLADEIKEQQEKETGKEGN